MYAMNLLSMFACESYTRSCVGQHLSGQPVRFSFSFRFRSQQIQKLTLPTSRRLTSLPSGWKNRLIYILINLCSYPDGFPKNTLKPQIFTLDIK
ncbi:MAG: hypothetical protein ACI8XG_001953 [Congregibacter sp.]|jgi:hypothetical protein